MKDRDIFIPLGIGVLDGGLFIDVLNIFDNSLFCINFTKQYLYLELFGYVVYNNFPYECDCDNECQDCNCEEE